MNHPSTVATIEHALEQLADSEKAAFFPRFFKAGPGEYAEGDQFLGVVVPHQRKIAKRFYQQACAKDVHILLQSPIHEHRLTALLILVLQFGKAKTDTDKQVIVAFYLDHLDYVNNWDLVDSSAHKILGEYLLEQNDRSIIYDLAASGHLWRQRIAIMTTMTFIKHNQFTDTIALAETYLTHTHDLIHKATGWLLREIGKQDQQVLLDFLQKFYQSMPRTMLRYSIEKLDPALRKNILAGTW